MKKIKVLTVGRKMHNSGGVQKYIYSLFNNMDLKKFEVNFLIPHLDSSEQPYLKKMKNKGVNIYLIPNYKENIIKNIVESYKIFKQYKNDIVHIHVSSGIYVVSGIIARIAGAKNIIYHSHNSSNSKSMGIKVSKLFYQMTGSFYLGCTKEAGRYLFGQKIVDSNNFKIANNGIDTKEFEFNRNKRNKIRKEFGITEKTLVLGFVGRLSIGKNVSFLIKLMNELKNLEQDIKLLIVGEGPEEKRILKLIKDYELENEVILTGNRDDIDYMMSSFDIFLLPSLYEALGLVLIEAQASGLICIASSAVARESNITDIIYYVDFNIKDWINKIRNTNKVLNRKKYSEKVKNANYDISTTTKEIEEVYKQLREK